MTDSNYHSHHRLCRHAQGTALDYVEKAIALGFKEIGISDHVPSKMLPDSMRMQYDELSQYFDDVLTVQKNTQDAIHVYLGMECEYLDEDPNYYAHFLNTVDYLVLGQHYVKENTRYQSAFNLTRKEQILEYGNRVTEALESGYFSLLAHPDLYMCGYDTFDVPAKHVAHQICQKAVALNIPLEFNANGIRRGLKDTSQGKRYPYPRLEFWEIAKTYPISVILSSDAHTPDKLYDGAMKQAEAMIEAMGLNRINRLAMKHLKKRF